MASGKVLVLLLAALAVAVAQHEPFPDPHDPAYDPFFHPTGRPKQNSLAGATSQQSPGFPEISKLLPLVQADTIGPNLTTATTQVVMAATWDFGNPALAPRNLFRPSATGRRLLADTSASKCAIADSSLGPNVQSANDQACAFLPTISSNCSCTGGGGRKLLANARRDLLQTFTFTGPVQFFGECKEDFFSLLANCNYVYDAASTGFRANAQIGAGTNKFSSCTLFYDDGSYVDSTTCFTTTAEAPTVVRLNAKAIEYAKNPSTGQASGLQPGARISPETFFAVNYINAAGFRFSFVFRPVQTFGVYINQEHQVFPGQ